MSGSGSGDDGTRKDDKRVKDLVRPAGVQEGGKLDDETIAQIAYWFGLPAATTIAEATVPSSPEASENENQRFHRKRAEVLQHVQPGMVARMEQHTTAADQILRVRDERPRGWERERVTTFDLARVPAIPSPDDWPQVRVSDDIARWLELRAPQAMLRDLHRPETIFERRFQPPWDDVFQPPDLDPFAAAREELARDLRPEAVPAAVTTVREASADLRGILAKPWAEAKRERARAREVELEAKLAAEAAERAAQKEELAKNPRPGGKPPGGRPVPRSPEKSP